MRSLGLGILIVVVNVTLFGVALSAAARFNDPRAMAVTVIIGYAVAGALSRLWSSRLWLAAVPAAAALALVVALLKWSAHLADTDGTFAYPFWRYMVPSSAPEGLTMLGALIAAGGAWVVVDRLRRRGSAGHAPGDRGLEKLEVTHHRAH